MSKYQTVAIRDSKSSDVISLFVAYGRTFERTHMEEYHDFWNRDQLGDEGAEDERSGFACFIEEDAQTGDGREDGTAVAFCQLKAVIATALDEVGGWMAVCGFRGPLLFLAEAPLEEDTSE